MYTVATHTGSATKTTFEELRAGDMFYYEVEEQRFYCIKLWQELHVMHHSCECDVNAVCLDGSVKIFTDEDEVFKVTNVSAVETLEA